MKLGEILMKAGLISQANLAFALQEVQRTGSRLGQVLIDRGLVAESHIYDALAQITALPRLRLEDLRVHENAIRTVTPQWANLYGSIPVEYDAESRTLTVIVSDPTLTEALTDLSFRTGAKIRQILGSDSEVQRLIRYAYYGEPLDRTLASRAPGRPSLEQVEIDESMIIRGMDGLRNEIQDTGNLAITTFPEEPREPASIASVSSSPSPLDHVVRNQQEAARVIRALFDLCIARGVITVEEYTKKLKRLT